MGRQFRWLWAAYAVSTFGTMFAFDAFTLVAIYVLDAGPAEVSLLAATGTAAGAVAAIPLGPWVEFQRKRPVLVATDLIRFAALMSVPAAFALGGLSFAQLLIVSVIVAAAGITFQAASGAYLKTLVRPEDLLVANGRFESTTWTATALGPPLGGVAVGMFGPVTTMLADAASYLLSALSLRAIGGHEPRPVRTDAPRARELFEGWRYVLTHAVLRRLLVNTALVNGLIMATAPLMAVLMLGHLGFTPWQYALALATPCVGGLIGARLARRFVPRFGQHRIMWAAGTLRTIWPAGLAFVEPGAPGLVLVMGLQLGLITCIGVFNPVFATYRLQQLPADRVTRSLTAWSVSTKATVAALTALWGVLAAVTSPRFAILAAGLLLLATPLLLPGRPAASRPGKPETPGSEEEPGVVRTVR